MKRFPKRLFVFFENCDFNAELTLKYIKDKNVIKFRNRVVPRHYFLNYGKYDDDYCYNFVLYDNTTHGARV